MSPKTLTGAERPQLLNCVAKNNRTVPCGGEFIPSEGLCLKHAVLFDVWICEHGGDRVYETKYPRNWKRSIFYKWLNKIGNINAREILKR